LCATFRISWHELEGLLAVIGEGDREYASDEILGREIGGSDRLGRVRIVYR